MGKGKGQKFRDKVCPMRPGKIIYELLYISKRSSTYAMKKAQNKISLLTGISYKTLYSRYHYRKLFNLIKI